jgi:cephalosporin-C deacetylase-like acetyl esterase
VRDGSKSKIVEIVDPINRLRSNDLIVVEFEGYAGRYWMTHDELKTAEDPYEIKEVL